MFNTYNQADKIFIKNPDMHLLNSLSRPEIPPPIAYEQIVNPN